MKVSKYFLGAIALSGLLALAASSAHAADILFVVNGRASVNDPMVLTDSDAWIKGHFSELLHTVTVVDDDEVTTASADGKGLIFISSSVDAAKVGTSFTETNIPLVTFDVESQKYLKMTGPTVNVDYGFTNNDVLHVEDKNHPLAAGLTGNRSTVLKNIAPMGWGEPTTSADIIARLIGDKKEVCIYVYEAGDVMYDSQVALERRIFFFMQDSIQLNANGIKLFDALVAYSLQISQSSASVAKVDDAAEPATTGHFKISRAGGTSQAVTVNYTVGGTATSGVDYIALAGSAFIPAGSNNAIVDVTPIDDIFAEGNETVTLTIVTGSGYNVGVIKNATVTIIENDDPLAPQANAGPDVYTNATFTQNGSATNALSVSWTQVSGPGTITFGSPTNPVTTITASAEGIYFVRLTVTGNTGATANDTAQVVWDTTKPTINTTSPNLTAEATSPAGATVTYDAATTSDNLSPVTVSYSQASGTTFPLGTTTVTVTATDAAGNSSTATFTVTVVDTTGPAINAKADITVEATSADGADVTFNLPGASDLVDLTNITISASPASGSTFALGTTVVTVTAKDTRNNSSTSTFNVIVVDTTDPTINPFENITAEATSAAGATVTFAPTASDTVDSSVTVTTSPLSGSTFPLGTTTVTVTATDDAGNSTGGTFTVTVRDTTPPVLTVPDDITMEPTDASGAVVTFSASATDLVSAADDITITYSKNSGEVFPIGVTTVTVTATDKAGNESQGTFTVTIGDATPPVITVPADITVEATGPNGAAVTYNPAPSAVDAIDGAVDVTLSHASGSTFPIGNTVVTASATDAAGNSASKTFNVTVIDTTGPAISGASNITAEATGPSGAAVTFTLTATDIVDGNLTVTATPASGSTFALGTTPVSASATDTRGNKTTVTFDVTVQDTTPPAITPPADIIAEATGPNGAAVTFTLSNATDLVDGSVTVSADKTSGAIFPIGQTTVTLTSTDSAGNTGTASFKITVVDGTGPLITPPSNITTEATGPNGAAVTFTLDPAADLVDGNVAVSANPASGSTFALGTTTVNLSAKDSDDNESTASFTVTVVDTTAPVITVPADITVEATGPDGATVTFNTSASDLVSGTVSVTASKASGSTFAVGTTTVLLTASDAAGNSNSAMFNVNVVDTTDPVITAPANITAEATGPNGAAVTFNASASDLVSGALTVTASHPSGSTFALGTTEVTLSATDGAGNAAEAKFTITVQDTTPPVIDNVPATITIEADNLNGMAVTFGGATATDLVSTPTVSYDITSGSTFTIGTTTVTITATDAANNSSTATFDVVILADATPPGILSGPTAVPNPAKINQTVTFSCTATDAVSWDWAFGDGALSTGKSTGGATHAYPAVGTYTATVTATDASGLTTVRSLQIVVVAEAVPPIDTDGDGIPDEFDTDDDNDGYTDDEENNAGSDPLDATSVPKIPMTVTKIAGSAKFNTPGRDQYTVAGILANLPTTFNPDGKTITVDLGGAAGTFKLDSKGRGKSANGLLRLKLKYKRNKATKKKEFVGGNVQFQAKIKGALGEKWKDEGVDPEKDKKKVTLPFVVDLTMDGKIYTDKPNTIYSSKAKKAGAIKFSRKVKLR